jgi:hypothetical protein
MSTIDSMANDIAKQLEAYTDSVGKKVKISVNKITKECIEAIKEKSPIRVSKHLRKYSGSGKSYKSGSYAKGWRMRNEYDEADDTRNSIYNAPHGSLTHLLENGHETPGGGTAKAIPHIRPAEQMAKENLIKAIENDVRA